LPQSGISLFQRESLNINKKNMQKNKLAIFDIDGTIFRKNLHFELIDELVWMKVFPKSARRELLKAYTSWLEHKGTYEDYRKRLVRLYSEHIKGCRLEDVEKASRAVVPFHKDRTYIFAEKLIKRLKKDSYHIIAVSGSPIEVVKEFNRLRLNFDEVFGSVYEMENNIYTGEEEFAPVRDKGQLIKQYVFENDLTLKCSYGVGDTESDASFLDLVENPIAFNPNKNLKEIAERKGWKIVVEKKDVIYRIA
ncbi:MAG: HAD family phosphatase, partial [Candidatus Moranbacteria bacterium]|nr:HAD family phosphatase [Candidatus Moranbacteria bacterium]